MKDIINKIKWAWQRAIRGYDDTFMWEMDTYFNYYFTPAIKKFCQTQLAESRDERFLKVFQTMLEKIEAWEKMDILDTYKHPNAGSEMWSYFGKNIGYFWN